MRLLLPQTRERTPWTARVLALLVGALGPAALAVAIRAPDARPSRVPDERAGERIVPLAPWTPGPSLPAVPAPDDTRIARPAGPVAPTASAQPRAATLPSPGPVAILPPPPAAADSTGTRGTSGMVHVPGARETFGAPALVAPLCLPPACGAGPAVAAGAAGRAGAGIASRPMSRAERDSIAHAVFAEAARKGGASGGAGGTLPPGVAGVSLQVGLPGGGPTAAQRARARVLDADVVARLDRIRTRADSLAELRRRDSVEALARGTQ